MSANIVIVGHIDHGKSTLIGRLLYDSQSIKGKKMEEIQKIAQEYKKRFEFAHLLDSLEEEVRGEKTIDTTQVIFKGENLYTIIDAPGHKEFLKNMLTGASYAHAAVVVISALEGIQEQTRRHLFLLNFLGLNQIFVCINKMDQIDYQQETFDRITEEFQNLLSLLDYCPKTLIFIPISALEGDNIYRKSDKMPWYKGSNLIQTLDANIKIQEKDISILRFVVQDVYDIKGEKVVVGRVEMGVLQEGDDVVFSPSGLKTKIKEIKVLDKKIKQAVQGDSIGVVLEDDSMIKRGEVCGLVDSHPVAKNNFLGEMFLIADELAEGESLLIKCATNKVKCQIIRILKKIDSETGNEIKQNIQNLRANEAALVELKTFEPIVVESYSKVPALGRFILEKSAKNIAAGIIP